MSHAFLGNPQSLGHQSVNTTLTYAHLAPQDDEINVL